jgi:signal transduction histidine kinase
MVARRHQMESILAARVDHAERRPTLLAVLSKRPQGFTRASDPPLLQLLARQATIALDNAYLHERTRIQAAEMEEQAEKLERAMTERSRFFASMSHEIRTPINAVIGYKELLSLGAYGEMNEQQRTAVERLGRSAQHLLELINDVLDISKIEAGKMEMNLEPTDLAMLIRETIPTIQILADEKGLAMEVRADRGAVLNTDPARVRQIILNLLSNAVKFTAEGQVEVELSGDSGAGYTIRVTDTGPGIAAEDQERIFEEFEQTHSHASSGGTGLGLPISKRLAHLLGGTLSVQSEVGKGSTFVLTLPDTPADTPSVRSPE